MLTHRVNPNGKITLSPQAFRLDDHRRIYRRHRTFHDRALELFFLWLLPAATLVLFVGCCIVTWWLLSAIGRALGGR